MNDQQRMLSILKDIPHEYWCAECIRAAADPDLTRTMLSVAIVRESKLLKRIEYRDFDPMSESQQVTTKINPSKSSEGFNDDRQASPLEQWQLVPKEPTKEMDEACTFGQSYANNRANYRAMLATAPSPPATAPARNDDTARIDWLDAQDHIHALQWQSGGRGTPIKTSLYDRNRVSLGEGISLRKAIDTAMQTQEVT